MRFEKIVLYDYPVSRAARVRWALHEIFGETLDPRIELRHVDLMAGEHFQPPISELNPNCSLPVMRIETEGGKALTMIESGAMVAFLADAFPEAELAPPPGDSLARADYLQALHYVAGWMDAHLWTLFQQTNLYPEDQRSPLVVEQVRRRFARRLEPYLKLRLEAGPYLCGERFTAADCVFGHNVGWAKAVGVADDPLFAAYRERIAARPAYQAAYAKK